MPKSPRRLPQLLNHHTGHCRVRIDGREIWLGRQDDPTTKEKYDRLIAEWLAAGRKLPSPAPAQASADPTVSVVMLDYIRHVDAVHPGNHGQQIKDALGVLRRLYGSVLAHQFTPANLEAVRQVWIEEELTRSTIQRKVNFIRALFKWAVSRGKLPPSVWQALLAVEGLRKGRTKAAESRKVGPVAERLIEAVRPHLPSPVRALVDLQLLTGARPGELLSMRAADIDMSNAVWTYTPQSHKTEHRGHDRLIFIGPRAQEVIRPFLPPARALDAALFSPREAAREQKGRGAKGHRRPNQKPNPTATDRAIGTTYTACSYRRCIERAIDKAFPIPGEFQPVKGDTLKVRAEKREERRKWLKAHRWHPHQLRHNAATVIRKLEGIEVARVVLGHSSANTTAIYAEEDRDKARSIIAKVG